MGLEFVSHFLNILSTVLYFGILARVLMSWIKVGPGSPFVPLLRLIYAITEPILGPIRRVLPKTGMFDFSPIVALLILDLIRRMIEKVLV
ncbi:MAG: hypothetical protein BZY65_00630 [SAR202 cluster bacterium Ae2-Chloro-G2]|nr:MAG: hypothetical protein BZY65_00630 [SAR202 cluster bacterium Ae2-Chloro-G2]